MDPRKSYGQNNMGNMCNMDGNQSQNNHYYPQTQRNNNFYSNNSTANNQFNNNNNNCNNYNTTNSNNFGNYNGNNCNNYNNSNGTNFNAINNNNVNGTYNNGCYNNNNNQYSLEKMFKLMGIMFNLDQRYFDRINQQQNPPQGQQYNNNNNNNSGVKQGVILNRNRTEMYNDINISFMLNQGQVYNMKVNPDEKVGNVINEFIGILGVKLKFENLSKFDMMFSFNSKDLKSSQYKTFREIGALNGMKICVIDMRNILGGRV